MKKNICPICKKEREGINENKHFPFCSQKCDMVDLYNWLNGEYIICEDVPEMLDNEREEPEKFFMN